MLLAVALMVGILSASAEETGIMTIKTTDGKTTEIQMAGEMNAVAYYDLESPESPIIFFVYTGYISFNNGKPVTGSSDFGTINFETTIDKMEMITFTGLDPAGVESVQQSAMNINLADGTISFSSVETPVQLTVTDMAGTSLINTEIKTDTTIDLKEFGHGIYAVRAGDKSFKILVK